jgi:hypothetical protein
VEIETAMDQQLSSIVTELSHWAASLRGGCARQCVFFSSILGFAQFRDTKRQQPLQHQDKLRVAATADGAQISISIPISTT